MKIDGVDSVIRRAGGIRKQNKVMYESFYKTTRGDVFVFTLPLMGDPNMRPEGADPSLSPEFTIPQIQIISQITPAYKHNQKTSAKEGR